MPSHVALVTEFGSESALAEVKGYEKQVLSKR